MADRFVVHLFEGHLSLADMERMDALALRWQAEHPGKRVELVVIFPSDARMNVEERQRMVALIKQGESVRAASATVILAEGLLASVQRSILTGMMLLAPPPHPVKIAAQIPDAVRWLYPHVRALSGPQFRLDLLASAVDANIAAFQARRA